MEEIIEPCLSEIIITSYDGEIDDKTGLFEGKGSAVFDNEATYEGNFESTTDEIVS